MSTALAARQQDDAYFTRAQIDTIKSVLCPGITDPELNLFSDVCKHTQLNPFARQIYVTKRSQWDAESDGYVKKMTIQTGIDGFRLIAERTGKYRGQKPFQWCGADGIWTDVWLQSKPPLAARATVLRSDFTEPLVRVARWDAYVQTKKGGAPNKMWSTMGAEQLAKCAEALALRTAFPQELSGLYTDDEMAQADNGKPELVERAPTNATPVDDKPATVPPPAAGPVMFGARYQVWGGRAIHEAPASVVLEYIGALEEVLKDPKKQNARAKTVAHLREVELAYDAIVNAEMAAAQARERQQVDVGGKLQQQIDGKDTIANEGPDGWQLQQEESAP
jgi:phage recombination protein Bet